MVCLAARVLRPDLRSGKVKRESREIFEVALFERFCQRKWLQLSGLRQWMRTGDEQVKLSCFSFGKQQ